MNLSARRMRLVHLFVVLFLAGSLVDIVTGLEHWPFSPYQMFSKFRKTDELVLQRLYGVIKGENRGEIPLYEFPYIQPFDKSRLARAFSKMRGKPNQDEMFLEAIRDCFRRYERLRREGRHDGPPLRGIRLYELNWRLEREAKNAETPDRRELLAEWFPRRGKGAKP